MRRRCACGAGAVHAAGAAASRTDRAHPPRGRRALLTSLRRIFGRLTYPLETVELEPGDGLERAGYRLETFAVNHGVPAVGYVLVEHERPGRFDVEAAQALGVPDGPERGV